MKIKNGGESFSITYSGNDFVIPSGIFDVNNDKLGYFIIKKAMFWGKPVEIITLSEKATIKPIEQTESKEQVGNEKVEDVTEEVAETPKQKGKGKTSGKIKDLEDSL